MLAKRRVPLNIQIYHSNAYVNGAYIGKDRDGDANYSYDPSDNTIRIMQPVRDEDFLCFLHELGHSYHHYLIPPPIDRLTIIRGEIVAWGFTLCCIKDKYFEYAKSIALRYLDSYRRFHFMSDRTLESSLDNNFSKQRGDANVLRYMYNHIGSINNLSNFTKLLKANNKWG
jgi:hypothetical protein